MKKYFTIIIVFAYFLAVGQKKEIKKAEKLFDSGDVQGASELLDMNKTLFDNADEKILLQRTYLEAKIDQKNSKFQSSYEKYQKSSNFSSVVQASIDARKSFLDTRRHCGTHHTPPRCFLEDAW